MVKNAITDETRTEWNPFQDCEYQNSEKKLGQRRKWQKKGKRKVIGTELYLERKRNNFKFTPKYSARFGYELKQSLEN